MAGDTYKTLAAFTDEILYKEKNSKFFGYAFPVTTEYEVRSHLESLRKRHPGAGHYCYAWRIGTDDIAWRANDDGEPNNSAGMPILGQLQSYGLTNVLVVVVRFFGGVKLGVSGLISAYRIASQMALAQSKIIDKVILSEYIIDFDYPMLSRVMRLIRQNNVEITGQDHALKCRISIAIRKRDEEKIAASFRSLQSVLLTEK